MRQFFLSLFFILLASSLIFTNAEAKRFGGGKSFGYSRPTRSASSPNYANQSRTPAQNKPFSASRWLGPLAGLAIGGLLASLFMGHGLGTGIMSWLMIAAGLFLIWQLISRLKQKPVTQQAYQNAAQPDFSNYQAQPQHNVINANVTHFDVNPFLRQAKTMYIRLQAAYDQKNLADIREFTTPQVFAEIQVQLSERSTDEINQTEVISIDAELLEHAIETDDTISVLFSGKIRENMSNSPENVKEIWHFTKHPHSKEWIVAGIQQA